MSGKMDPVQQEAHLKECFDWDAKEVGLFSANFIAEAVSLFYRNPDHLKLLGSNSSLLAGTTTHTGFTFHSSPVQQYSGEVLHLLT